MSADEIEVYLRDHLGLALPPISDARQGELLGQPDPTAALMRKLVNPAMWWTDPAPEPDPRIGDLFAEHRT